ncbi:MAG TPA: hypothetical protein VGE40_03350 [Bacilli bacterium]
MPTDSELLQQMVTQNEITHQQLATTNDYLSFIVIAIGLIAILLTFYVAFSVTKGRD